ncbi:MAG TPA: hypothetical protein VM077_02015 [Candidatus Limnocylindrales bacterium]|nr:hypothetical protein [Candidatus Limnocylindrales bacterium]
MAKYELSKDWIKENASKIKQGYNIALVEKYDISLKEDVLKILEEVDHENASEENAIIFSKVLQLFVQGLKKRFEVKNKVKSKIVN